MLCPKIHRQRCAIEFITERNLYDHEVVGELFENFLHDLCGSLGMTPFIGPIVEHVYDGTSAYMGWLESGVQIHSWFEHKFVSVDIYSCKPYMMSSVLDVIEYWFEPKEIEIV